VLLFCLPASFIFDFVLKVWTWALRRLSSGPQFHDKRVKEIQAKVNPPTFSLVNVTLVISFELN